MTCAETGCDFYVDEVGRFAAGQRVWLALRPEKIRLTKEAPSGARVNRRIVVCAIAAAANVSRTPFATIKINGSSADPNSEVPAALAQADVRAEAIGADLRNQGRELLEPLQVEELP